MPVPELQRPLSLAETPGHPREERQLERGEGNDPGRPILDPPDPQAQQWIDSNERCS